MANVSTDIPDNASSSNESDSATLQEAVDKLVNEIDGTISSMTQDGMVSDDLPAAEPIDDQVDNLVSDASQASESFEAPSIDELDARLATVADDEMDFEGDFETTSAIHEPEQIDTPAPVAETAVVDDAPGAPESDEVEGDFEVPGAQAPDDEVEGDFEAPSNEPSTTEPGAVVAPQAAPESADEPIPETADGGASAKTKSVDITRVVSGGAMSAAKIVNIPLSRASKSQRDTIGWVALNTIFLAMCVWLYVLLIR